MKYIIKLVLVAGFASLLLGCGEKNTTDTTAAVSAEQAAQPVVVEDPAALFRQGISYRDEGKSAEAFEMFTKAANLGERDAMLFLGIMYENGESTAADQAKAVEWLSKSAELGNGSAPARLKALKAKMAKAK